MENTHPNKQEVAANAASLQQPAGQQTRLSEPEEYRIPDLPCTKFETPSHISQSWVSDSRYVLTFDKGVVCSTALTAPFDVKKRKFTFGMGPAPHFTAQNFSVDYFARIGDADVVRGYGTVCTYLNGKLGQPVYKSQSDVHAIKIHNGQLFLAHKDGKLARVDPASKQEEHLLPGEKVCDVCFGPKGDMYFLTQAGEVGSASSKQRVKLQAPEKLQAWWSLNWVDNNLFATGYV